MPNLIYSVTVAQPDGLRYPSGTPVGFGDLGWNRRLAGAQVPIDGYPLTIAGVSALPHLTWPFTQKCEVDFGTIVVSFSGGASPQTYLNATGWLSDPASSNDGDTGYYSAAKYYVARYFDQNTLIPGRIGTGQYEESFNAAALSYGGEGPFVYYGITFGPPVPDDDGFGNPIDTEGLAYLEAVIHAGGGYGSQIVNYELVSQDYLVSDPTWPSSFGGSTATRPSGETSPYPGGDYTGSTFTLTLPHPTDVYCEPNYFAP